MEIKILDIAGDACGLWRGRASATLSRQVRGRLDSFAYLDAEFKSKQAVGTINCSDWEPPGYSNVVMRGATSRADRRYTYIERAWRKDGLLIDL